MSENIRVSEVSDILRQQLEGIETKVQLDERGTVLQVSDGVVRIYGLRNAEANELLEFDNGIICAFTSQYFYYSNGAQTEAPKLYRLLNSDDFDTIRRLVEELTQ